MNARAVAVLLLLPTAVQGESTAPKVVSVAIPEYPSVARAARVVGTVVVRVEVTGSGTVASAMAEGGPSLLREQSVLAAKRWKFVAGGEAIMTHLTFAYSLAPFEECEADTWSTYTSPLSVAVRAPTQVTTTVSSHGPSTPPTPPPTPRPCE